MKFCPECGSKLTPGAKFCSECGYKIISVENTPVTNVIQNDENAELENNVENVENDNRDLSRQDVYETSEDFLKDVLNEFDPGTYKMYVVPNIPGKILLNLPNAYSKEIDINTVIGVFDTTLLESGKDGIVFTGERIYFSNNCILTFNEIAQAKYIEKQITDGEETYLRKLVEITKKNGEVITLDSSTFNVNVPLKLIADVCDRVNFESKVIAESNQYAMLADLAPECTVEYLKVIMNFLREDDGQIDKREYSELIAIMARLNISKEMAQELREYRILEDSLEETESIIENLKELIPHGSQKNIFHSLIKDILLTNKAEIDNWKDNSLFDKYRKLLNISESQIDFFIRKIKLDDKILQSRLEDTKIDEQTKELTAIGSAAGVSMGALAITGAVAGYGGISGGLFALSMMSTGGLAVGVLVIGGLGYGAYKGVKSFSGTDEKYKIRISMLQDKIQVLQKSKTILLDDINWTTRKIAEALESRDEIIANTEELKRLILSSKMLSESSDYMEEEEKTSSWNLALANLPTKLDIEKYTELVNKDAFSEKLNELMFQVYNQKETEEGVEYVLVEDLDTQYYETGRSVLERIGYFDTKKAATAKAAVNVKKGINSLKGFFK